MRPSSRQRVAAWLLALPLGRGGEECARRGRLEMISFWLLCWKLLRATAGLRRTIPELTDGKHDNSNSGNNNLVDNSSTPTQPTDPVTMEMSSSPPLTDLDRGNLFSCHSHEVEELQYPEVHGVEEAAVGENGKRNGDECDYLVFEIGGQKGKERGHEIEGGQDTEKGREEGEDRGRGETEGQDERRDPAEQAVSATLQEAGVHSLGNRDDLSDGHLSDCLQAELAIVYSDSEAGEDQWAAFTVSDATNQEEADLFLRSPSVSSTASSTAPDRRETLSANVSTEHVDFLLARQQWKKMEQEVKGQPIPKPGLTAQGSFQGTHTSLYPPTRSPRLKHREIHPAVPRETPLSCNLSPSSEDSGLDELAYRSPQEEPESAVEREIRLTLEREERHRRERGMITQGLTLPRPPTLQTGRSPPRPPASRTPTLSISPSPSGSSALPRPVYHEMTANNVIILEPDSSSSASRNRPRSSAIGGLSDWPTSLDAVPSANIIVVETSNLIIRSASEFCLSSAPMAMETQESTFSSNPFFKLRSLSSQSLVEQEIRLVRQREEEWRRQREEMWRRSREEEWRRGRERYDTVLVSPGLNDNITYDVPVVPDRCVSSPSSPSRTRKMERSSLSCDHKFPPSLSSVPRRQNAMAQRWEASLLANQKKE
uniref:uncharacterized protein LOC109971404 n=1 Tax=Monopterus albus TaxID=43700 RepID=UPI0009B3391B|nr:uncharacterized protein LOC109971404 [Monopterus albus]